VAVCEEHLGIVLRGVVKLRRAVELIDTDVIRLDAGKVSGEAVERNRPLILRQDNIGQLATDRSQVNVFLIRPPSPFGVGQQTQKMKLIVLTIVRKGNSVAERAEIGASLGPNVVGFRTMDMGIIPAGRGQDVVVARGISYLSADVAGGSVNQAIDERGVGVLKNLLDGTGKLVVRLRPVVVFH